jgi:hypothetical protein
MQRIRVVTGAVLAGLMTAASLAGAAAAQAAEPYDCAAKSVCVWDAADGTGESFAVEPKWQGGIDLSGVGWDTRASSIKNARTGTGPSATLYLYSGSAETCWQLHGTVAPGVGTPLPAGVDNHLDSIYMGPRTLNLCP